MKGYLIALSMFLVAACTAQGPLTARTSPAAVSPSATATISPSASATAAVESPSPEPTPTPSAPPPPISTSTPAPLPLPPGTWSLGAPMTAPRADFAAAMLFGGKVLLIGGQTSAGATTASVDLFDPSTNKVSAVAPMPAPRQGQSATLLPNGKVIVVGGKSSINGAALASAELYDPGTNTWSPVASMDQPREHHAAIWLNNGKLLVVGGDGGSLGDPNTDEVYDTGSNTWTSLQTPYGDRPNGPAVVVLTDSRVMIWGGVAQVQPGNNVELYDPRTGQESLDPNSGCWTATNWSTAATLMGGTVLIMGGQQSYQPAGALNTTTIYDPSQAGRVPATGPACAAGPAMNVGHCHNTISSSSVGVVVAGGRCGSSDSIAATEIYNPNSNTWSRAAVMQVARGFHVAVTLTDGRVLVAGGFTTGGAVTNTTELYTPA